MTPSPSLYGDGYCKISITTLSPGLRPLGTGITDRDRIVECRAVDLDEAGSAGFKITADEDPGRPREHLDDPPFGIQSAAPGSPGDLDGDLVAGRGVACGLGRNVYLVDSRDGMVRTNESESFGRPPEQPHDHS